MVREGGCVVQDLASHRHSSTEAESRRTRHMNLWDLCDWVKVGLYLLCCRCICLSCLFNSKATDKPPRIAAKVLLLGLPSSGKTTFANNFHTMCMKASQNEATSASPEPTKSAVQSKQAFPTSTSTTTTVYKPTQGLVLHKEIWYREFKLQLVEIGGSFKKYWKKYTADSQALIYLIHANSVAQEETMKASIDALETFAVGNEPVRSWPVCILVTHVDTTENVDQILVDLEKYINARHMLKAWLPNLYISTGSSCSNATSYPPRKAEEDLRTSMDFLVVGTMNLMIQKHYEEMEQAKEQ